MNNRIYVMLALFALPWTTQAISPAQDAEATRAETTQAISISKDALQANKQHATTKLGPHLENLQDRARSKTRASTLLAETPFMRVKGDQRIQVYISLKNSEPDAIAILESIGVEIELVNKDLNKVQAWLSAETLNQLILNDNVISIDTPNYGAPRQGSALTQGDQILKASRLRQLGFTGQGIRVGVVSDGANDWRTARSSGDLPNQITTYGSCNKRAENQSSCISAKTCNEGTAMAEIIHDIAPDAQLAVAAVNTSLEFIQRINQLANSFGADVIVDDLGFFGEPYFEDGDIAKAVQALPDRVLYVSSAGNSGHTHYQADFVDSNVTTANKLHDFAVDPATNTDAAQGFVVAAKRGAFVLLQWNDPYSAAQSDFDLYVSSRTQLVGSSVSRGSRPIEAVCTYNPSSSTDVFFAQVDKFAGDDKKLKMYFLGASSIEYPMRSGSIFGHPGTNRAIAVGSINADDPGNDTAAFYSSGGPATIDFPSKQVRRKPDLVAIDGVNVSGAGGFPSSFFGTSAAAPHVAGVAALVMSANPNASASVIKTALTRSATDLGAKGFDSIYGNGLVDALAANNALPLPNPAPFIMLLLGDEEDE